eukprot:CAMPEP_0197540666 /NCGR_PEP_ID=MMETSP1318-20131121/66644_1 /TAXON_ID=552666 /ORGANISM="Partenskyella glossopodia, Strain RCC365" /LENGTH=683 /DNA_ID=CAMNT_0043099737 /DNA_START=194 /DNA_END=2245 /DNA_ORIENTATION=-
MAMLPAAALSKKGIQTENKKASGMSSPLVSPSASPMLGTFGYRNLSLVGIGGRARSDPLISPKIEGVDDSFQVIRVQTRERSSFFVALHGKKRSFSACLFGIHPGILNGGRLTAAAAEHSDLLGLRGGRKDKEKIDLFHMLQASALIDAQNTEIQKILQFRSVRGLVRTNNKSFDDKIVVKEDIARSWLKDQFVPVGIRWIPLLFGAFAPSSATENTHKQLSSLRGRIFAALERICQESQLGVLNYITKDRAFIAQDIHRSIVLVEVRFKDGGFGATVHLGLDARKTEANKPRRAGRATAIRLLESIHFDSVLYDEHVAWLYQAMTAREVSTRHYELDLRKILTQAVATYPAPPTHSRNFIICSELEVSSFVDSVDISSLMLQFSQDPAKYGVKSLAHLMSANLDAAATPFCMPFEHKYTISSNSHATQTHVWHIHSHKDHSQSTPGGLNIMGDTVNADSKRVAVVWNCLGVVSTVEGKEGSLNLFILCQRSNGSQPILQEPTEVHKMMETATSSMAAAIQEALVHHVRDAAWMRILRGSTIAPSCVEKFENLVYRRSLASLDSALRCLEMLCKGSSCSELFENLCEEYGGHMVREFKLGISQHLVVFNEEDIDIAIHIKVSQTSIDSAKRGRLFLCRREMREELAGTEEGLIEEEIKFVENFVNACSRFMFRQCENVMMQMI